MKKLILTIELTLDDEPRDADELKALHDILYQRGDCSDRLILHSNYVGDELGPIRVIDIKEPSNDPR